MSSYRSFSYRLCLSLVAVAAAMIVVLVFCSASYSALSIDPHPSPGVTPGASLVPIITPTPRPTVTPWNQVGNSVTPTPQPTGNPLVQQFIREDIAKALEIDVAPTPPKATKNKQLDAKKAAEDAVGAAKASFLSLEITRLNIQKQIESLRESVNMAIRALDADDRYKVLIEAEELWGERLDEELQMELEMYRMIDYEALTSDQRRELISVRDMGYDRFKLNITRVDHNIEIMRNQLIYAAYAQYAGVAKMQAAISMQQESLDLQKKNLDILKVKYELGTAARIDVENAEISYERSQIDIRRQRRSLTSLVTSLNRLVGENLATTYEDFDRTKLTPPRRDDPAEKYVDDAVSKRSEILLAKEEMDLARKQAKLYDTEITNFSTLDDKQDALQAAEEAIIAYESIIQEVEAEISSAYKQLVALRGLTSYYESQINTAQETYERAQVLYDLGTTTIITVDQAAMSLTQAKIQRENNLIDIWLQRQKLDIISGIGPGGL